MSEQTALFYLFLAYAGAFLILFAFNLKVAARTRKLEQEIQLLRKGRGGSPQS